MNREICYLDFFNGEFVVLVVRSVVGRKFLVGVVCKDGFSVESSIFFREVDF